MFRKKDMATKVSELTAEANKLEEKLKRSWGSDSVDKCVEMHGKLQELAKQCDMKPKHHDRAKDLRKISGKFKLAQTKGQTAFLDAPAAGPSVAEPFFVDDDGGPLRHTAGALKEEEARRKAEAAAASYGRVPTNASEWGPSDPDPVMPEVKAARRKAEEEAERLRAQGTGAYGSIPKHGHPAATTTGSHYGSVSGSEQAPTDSDAKASPAGTVITGVAAAPAAAAAAVAAANEAAREKLAAMMRGRKAGARTSASANGGGAAYGAMPSTQPLGVGGPKAPAAASTSPPAASPSTSAAGMFGTGSGKGADAGSPTGGTYGAIPKLGGEGKT